MPHLYPRPILLLEKPDQILRILVLVFRVISVRRGIDDGMDADDAASGRFGVVPFDAETGYDGKASVVTKTLVAPRTEEELHTLPEPATCSVRFRVRREYLSHRSVGIAIQLTVPNGAHALIPRDRRPDRQTA